jgi:ATP-dependent protease ClpP protease subunit
MAKDILIYGDVQTFMAAEFIRSVDELNESDPLVVRINTNGGDPQTSFGMIAKFQEFNGEKIVRVDGKAYSTGFFMCCFADNVEALDVSQFLIHRAAYPGWIESNPDYFTDDLKANLKTVNDSLLKALKSKIDVEAFEKISGTTLKEIFSMDSRKDVFIDAKQAKKIGLVSKINKITPTMAAEISNSYAASMAAVYQPENPSAENQNKNQNKMNKEDFKKENPEAYKAIVKDSTEAGVKTETERVAAWMEHVEVDPQAVKKGIESGKEITKDEMKAFYKKAAQMEAKAEAVEGLEAEAEKTEKVETDAPKEDANADAGLSELEAFEAKVDAKLGIEKNK